ncbi:hypothetical protein AXG93_145s1000 [Marchantia polymorpha subsp. ruderalis]|uniref:Uncharacterized protein n=1 Tax=Marchantia polymorpha subsp. ruderalis TaxID=1480154 RepID=A0A176WD95_MARPO|nr:hypothetical protein AXG93_145s1000 [Marchantia polymorpha subsp. ruderalis]
MRAVVHAHGKLSAELVLVDREALEGSQLQEVNLSHCARELVSAQPDVSQRAAVRQRRGNASCEVGQARGYGPRQPVIVQEEELQSRQLAELGGNVASKVVVVQEQVHDAVREHREISQRLQRAIEIVVRCKQISERFLNGSSVPVNLLFPAYRDPSSERFVSGSSVPLRLLFAAIR